MQEKISFCQPTSALRDSWGSQPTLHTFANRTSRPTNRNLQKSAILQPTKHFVYLRMDVIKENISLKELTELENLSVRSSNVCEWNGLNDLQGILNYFWDNNNFFGLRNCGQKSNTELIELCQKYEDFATKPKIVKPENPIENLIDNLTARQRKILNNLIESQVINLSVRSLNAIEKLSDSSLTIRGLKEILIDPKYNLRKIKNIGEKSVNELAQFFKEVREQIEIVHLFENDDELTIELFNTYLRRKFCLKPENIVKIWNNYDSENGLPVFKTIDTLISSGYIFNDNEQEIFNRGFNFWNDSSPEKLEDIASDIRLTRERTRQIRKKLLDEFDLKFAFLQGLEFDAINLYGLNTDSDIIIVNESLIDEIQQKENVSYNNVFVTKILSIIFNKSHAVVGNIESLTFNIVKYKGVDSRWNSIYLIKKELKESYDFESLVIDVKRRLSERIEEDYSFHFETYLTAFQQNGVEIDYFVITQIAEHIIFNEFEISIDTYDQITFGRNTKKQVIEYVYDILKEKNEPLDIYQIYETLISKHPNVTKSAEALRGSCQRDSNLIFFGRSSTYGLRIWEKDDFVKGGTMHDIAEEYLIQFDEPKHIDEITEYVSQYRPEATPKNLLYNLKSAENRRFRFFKNSHIGLMSKEYDTHLEINNLKYGTRQAWDDSFTELHIFCEANGRLPISSAIGKERKLYNFMNVQRNRIKKLKLSTDKDEKIKSILLIYPVLRKKPENRINNTKSQDVKSVSERVHTVTNRWWDSYNKLVTYLEQNKFYPTASIERALYTFCYNCKRGLESGNLHSTQIDALERINFAFGTASINSWDDNYEELKLFKTKNNGWPKCIDSDKKQIRLYRYCMSLFKAYKNDTLSAEQLEKLDKIEFPYQLGVFSNKWLDNYEKLKKFRAINSSIWPRAKASDLEKPLYQFCYRNRNKFINGTLEDYKIQLLNEINFDFYG